MFFPFPPCRTLSRSLTLFSAKRYERLLKAHDIVPAPATPKKSAGDPATPTKGSARKRKAPKVEKTEDDDEEVKSEGNQEKKLVKRESKRAKTADYKSSEYVNDGSSNLRLRDIPEYKPPPPSARTAASIEVVTVIDDDDDDDDEDEDDSQHHGGHGHPGFCAECLPPAMAAPAPVDADRSESSSALVGGGGGDANADGGGAGNGNGPCEYGDGVGSVIAANSAFPPQMMKAATTTRARSEADMAPSSSSSPATGLTVDGDGGFTYFQDHTRRG